MSPSVEARVHPSAPALVLRTAVWIQIKRRNHLAALVSNLVVLDVGVPGPRGWGVLSDGNPEQATSEREQTREDVRQGEVLPHGRFVKLKFSFANTLRPEGGVPRLQGTACIRGTGK